MSDKNENDVNPEVSNWMESFEQMIERSNSGINRGAGYEIIHTIYTPRFKHFRPPFWGIFRLAYKKTQTIELKHGNRTTWYNMEGDQI